MGWTQTLELAHTLTKAIQANVTPAAAAPTQQTIKEPVMSDPATVSDQEPEQPQPVLAPAADVQATQEVPADINTILKNAATLAQALHEKPEVLSFMHALLGKNI